MVGNIICPDQFESAPFNPDDYFDPTTHIATEANFIKLLEDGIYDSSLIGYKVQLANSNLTTNGIWVIADVDHDAEHTGQSNCYDLISEQCCGSDSYGGNYWRVSSSRTLLNSTIYDAFNPKFQIHMINPKYKVYLNYAEQQYNDDKVILLSNIEVNGEGNPQPEGVPYPIFTNETSRQKRDALYTLQDWWLRTMDNSSGLIGYVATSGGASSYMPPYYGCSLVPLIRVQ